MLTHFADDDGVKEAKRLRLASLAAFAEREGIGRPAAATQARPRAIVHEQPAAADEELVAPAPEMVELPETPLGDERLMFEPWTIVQAGSAEVLDSLRTVDSKTKLRTVAAEITEFEGPIQIDRLISLVAQSFGMQRVSTERRRQIRPHIERAGLYVDQDKFVWPPEIEPSLWDQFRPNDSSSPRDFTEVSPVEVANAMRYVQKTHPGIAPEDVDRLTLQTFGRKRRTPKYVKHLGRARALIQP